MGALSFIVIYLFIMRFIFQAHDYSVNTSPCEESCTVWTEELASPADADALLDAFKSDDDNVKISYYPA